MNAKEIISKYIDDEKTKELFEELKKHNVYFANEENLDIRYSKLKEDMTAKNKLYEEAQKHIDELSQGVKSGEELKAKQAEYEAKIQQLESENKQIRIEGILREKLSKANATDTDYIIYRIKNRLQADGKTLELDESNNIKGIDEIIEAEKKSNASFFKTESMSKEVEIQNVGKGEKAEAEPKNLIEALRMRDNNKQE